MGSYPLPLRITAMGGGGVWTCMDSLSQSERRPHDGESVYYRR